MIRPEKKLGEILVRRKLITEPQLEDALGQQRKNKEFLGEILLKEGFIQEEDLLSTLAEQFGLQVISLKNRYIDWELVKNFSSDLILDSQCFPLDTDLLSVTFAITNPLDAWAISKAEGESRGLKVNFVLVPQEDMNEVVLRYKQYIRSNISGFFK